MTNLSSKIRVYLGRKINFTSDVILQDDGEGAYIKEWNVEEAQPTEEQLNALEAESTTLVNNNAIRATRKSAYGDIGDQLDEIFKNIDDWKTRIQSIKDANPKE